jgi:5-formyltetrahydrofolate cyclo-ligase
MNLPPVGASKHAWRIWARRTRKLFTSSSTNVGIVSALSSWGPYQAAEYVLTYLAFGSEPDLQALEGNPGKNFYVTRTWPGEPHRQSIHRLERNGLERYPNGFLQPPEDTPEVDPGIVEMVLVPGLAFDKTGGRLGYGLGYYDQLLSRLDPDALRIGVTPVSLVVPQLPTDNQDIAMTHLVTEQRIAPTAVD